MEFANDPLNRVKLDEGRTRRRQLLNLFYKYIGEDVTIMNTLEYERLINDNKQLRYQIKVLNEIRKAEVDRRQEELLREAR